MKVLVTGSNGQVGSAVLEKRNWTGLDLNDADIEQDITEEAGVIQEIEELNPDAIVHTAALTDLDEAEENPRRARGVNVEGTRNMLKAADRCGARLIFISTDYVFDGERGDYSVEDEAKPVSVYAKTKAEAEEMVQKSDVKSTIFRPSVVFNEDHDNFMTWAKSELEEKGKVSAITNQVCCPTYAPNLADFIIEAVEKGIRGTYHVVGNSKVTRYESVQIMKEELGLDGDVKSIKMEDLPWKAHRPMDSSLSMAKAKQDFDTKSISISEGFNRMYR
jgi:dTDP-4-dehydrorhamnose reductase